MEADARPAGERRPSTERRHSRRRPPDVHINLNVRGIGPSATMALNELSDRLVAQGREIFKLGLGQSPFPVPRAVVEELQANAHQKAYLPVRGLGALRASVAEYLRRTQGIPVSEEDTLVGPGSKELMFLLQLVYYGDLIIPSPAWVSYAPQATIIGRRILWVPTSAAGAYRIDPERIRDLCRDDPDRPRILVLNYPSNPTGVTYNLDELREIARIAREFRIVVLSDEIYGELHHKGQHVSIARLYPEGTVVSTGLSKWCGAGGWRLGVFVFPPTLRWLLEAMAAVASETYTTTSSPIQYAAVRAFQGGLRIERYLRDTRRVLSALGRAGARRLREAGVDVPRPQGGFYLFPDLASRGDALAARGIGTSAEMCERLLSDTGVAVLPGSVFGRPPSELTFRMAYVDFDGARALAAAEVLRPDEAIDDAFLESHCRKVMTAVDRLVEWIA